MKETQEIFSVELEPSNCVAQEVQAQQGEPKAIQVYMHL